MNDPPLGDRTNVTKNMFFLKAALGALEWLIRNKSKQIIFSLLAKVISRSPSFFFSLSDNPMTCSMKDFINIGSFDIGKLVGSSPQTSPSPNPWSTEIAAVSLKIRSPILKSLAATNPLPLPLNLGHQHRDAVVLVPRPVLPLALGSAVRDGVTPSTFGQVIRRSASVARFFVSPNLLHYLRVAPSPGHSRSLGSECYVLEF